MTQAAILTVAIVFWALILGTMFVKTKVGWRRFAVSGAVLLCISGAWRSLCQ